MTSPLLIITIIICNWSSVHPMVNQLGHPMYHHHHHPSYPLSYRSFPLNPPDGIMRNHLHCAGYQHQHQVHQPEHQFQQYAPVEPPPAAPVQAPPAHPAPVSSVKIKRGNIDHHLIYHCNSIKSEKFNFLSN